MENGQSLEGCVKGGAVLSYNGGMFAVIDRLDYKIVGLAILFLLCWMGFCPLAGRSTVAWSDDFNDGNYDGWTICDNRTFIGGRGSDWSASNLYLQIDQEDFGIISHPSNVAYGTWSFDFKADETQVGSGAMAGFSFISGNLYDWSTLETDWTIYYLSCDAVPTAQGFEMRLRLAKRISGAQTDIEYSDTLVPLEGWHHIDVTRTEAGLFSVYHNGSLVVQAADTDLDSSEMFWLFFRYGSMTDNIVVDDEITINPPIDWLSIAIIGGSAVVIIAVVVIFLRRR